MKKNIFEKKSEFKCDRILNIKTSISKSKSFSKGLEKKSTFSVLPYKLLKIISIGIYFFCQGVKKIIIPKSSGKISADVKHFGRRKYRTVKFSDTLLSELFLRPNFFVINVYLILSNIFYFRLNGNERIRDKI